MLLMQRRRSPTGLDATEALVSLAVSSESVVESNAKALLTLGVKLNKGSVNKIVAQGLATASRPLHGLHVDNIEAQAQVWRALRKT